MSKPSPEQTKEPQTRTVTINVIKGANFHIVHGGAFYVQADPLGGARISVMADRVPYLPKIVHKFIDGKLGDEVNPNTDLVDVFEREVQLEIATNDQQALNLLHNLHMYLVYRGVLQAPPATVEQPKTE